MHNCVPSGPNSQPVSLLRGDGTRLSQKNRGRKTMNKTQPCLALANYAALSLEPFLERLQLCITLLWASALLLVVAPLYALRRNLPSTAVSTVVKATCCAPVCGEFQKSLG